MRSQIFNDLTLDKFCLVITIFIESFHGAINICIKLCLIFAKDGHILTLWNAVNNPHIVRNAARYITIFIRFNKIYINISFVDLKLP